ncbi:hypothetical protein [Reichenbachiella agariperforans]|uniref:hypothetical protein n=1 Tax=Reichenbachiella agariperforans TaxID=156994 RepID=UPI001C09B5C6|nr:hypothetical protein [Reichenbachiella agariperforans]MBU2914550.1 hypothetical protein [Reichenbachiella agariperforans]
MSKQKYLKADWDPRNSTFKQVIIFRNSEIQPIVGFSARVGFNESKNKDNLLKRWFLRNYKNGYLNFNPERTYDQGGKDEVFRIDYYQYSKQSGDHKTLIVSLFQDFHEWQPSSYIKDVDIFLNEFYHLKSVGKDPARILSLDNEPPQYSDLNPNRSKFRHKNALRSFCVNTFKDGAYSSGELKNYYIKYCDRWFRGFGNDGDQDFLNGLFGATE